VNPAPSFKLSRRPLAIIVAVAVTVAAALAASADAGAATSSHRHASSRNCNTRRAHVRRRRCGHTARYRASHHRRVTNPRRNLPVQQLTSVTPPAPATPPAPETCTNTELVPTSSNIAEVRAATLCLINHERAVHGDSPLSENTHLVAAAQGHSEDMVSRNYFSHTTPTGEAFNTRILATGYVQSNQAYELGENIDCATSYLATPAATVSAWMNSPDHRENILNGEYRDSGIGVAAAAPESFSDGQAGATYTQDFGIIA
jgi:uncharacterized protein YkwD